MEDFNLLRRVHVDVLNLPTGRFWSRNFFSSSVRNLSSTSMNFLSWCFPSLELLSWFSQESPSEATERSSASTQPTERVGQLIFIDSILFFIIIIFTLIHQSGEPKDWSTGVFFSTVCKSKKFLNFKCSLQPDKHQVWSDLASVFPWDELSRD